MLHTERTDQAYKLLKSYARTPEQEQAVKEAYIEMLDADSEDQVVLRVIGCIFDGLRFGMRQGYVTAKSHEIDDEHVCIARR